MRLSDIYKKFGLYIILLVLILCFSFLSPNFLNLGNIILILRQISMLGIVCMGTMIVMCSGGMDLSIGSNLAMTGVLAAFLMVNMGIDPLPAILISITAGIFVGLINGVLGVILNVHPLIITLAMMQIIRGIAYLLCGGWPINGLPDTFVFIGQGYLGFIPVPVIIFIVVLLLVAFLLNKTVFGRYVYAIGGNAEATRLAGVNVNKMKVLFYTISGLTASIAGIVMAARLNSGLPSAGGDFAFDVVTAAVLGGVSIQGGEGKVFSVFIGVLIMGVLSNGMVQLSISDYYQTIIRGSILLLAVAIDARQHKEKKPRREKAIQSI